MKKISAIGVLVSIIAVAGVCGCASKSGESSNEPSAQSTTAAPASQPQKKPKDKRPLEQRLAVGMTMDQVRDACGNPKNIAQNSDGSATWMYNDAEKSFIPYYSLGGGKIHYVTVIFDNNGKVKSWSSGSSGMY
jgi:outer membrane protein assembly factor BamE (lipoprotein component of BamABCDE complex)